MDGDTWKERRDFEDFLIGGTNSKEGFFDGQRERCTGGRKGGLADALRGGGERKDFSWLSMRRKRIGVHRSLGGFGEKEPISLEAEQYFSKAGSSKYSYMKLTSSHLYLILHCFSFFFANPGIILLIGVDGKGHRLFY